MNKGVYNQKNYDLWKNIALDFFRLFSFWKKKYI
jgi:hypothetical protein